MDKRNIIKTGDLVRWYDLYGDIHIVKNTGLGIVIEIVSYMFGDNESLIYKVLSKSGKLSNFEQQCIEHLKIEAN